MIAFDTKASTSTYYTCPDCSAFLNWTEEKLESEDEKAVIFRSLVATMKTQPAFDVNLEAKALKFLQSVIRQKTASADAFLRSFASFSADSLNDFVQSIAVLISSPSQAIIKSSMKMLRNLLFCCSANACLALVKADLIPQLIIALNPHSLSFSEAVDIHTFLIHIISNSIWRTTNAFALLAIEDRKEQLAVCEAVLQQVLAHSEKYIRHLCVNRFSIVHGDFSTRFLLLLAQILRISPSYRRTMDFVLHMPVVLTISFCLAFFENDESIGAFLFDMNNTQRDWNEKGGEVPQMGKTVHRMLRMEGIEDVIEEKLRNDQYGRRRGVIVDQSIKFNNSLGMNLPKQK